MSFFHVTTFVACWTPFLVISLWHICDEKTVQNVSPIVQDILFLTAVLNSCLNPFVYGGFYVRNVKRRRSLRAPESYRSMALKRVATLQSNSSARRKNGEAPNCATSAPGNGIGNIPEATSAQEIGL